MSPTQTALINCMMCGAVYDPSENSSCPGCPINKGCLLVCCPKCGYESIDTNRSSLVRWASGWRNRFRRQAPQEGVRTKASSSETTLADLPPGRQACVYGFHPQISGERKARLQAYGLTPGQIVTVVQHNPVTIVVIEHLELALEGELAKSVLVK